MASCKSFGITTTFILLGILTLHIGLAQNRTLGFFLQQARENSPVIKEFQNQVLANRLDSAIFGASLKPRADLISTNSFAPVVNRYGYDEAITNGTTLSELIQVSRNFISRGNKTAQYQTIQLQNQALTDTIQLSQRDLVKTITEQYIFAYGSQLAMDFNKEVYGLLQQEESALKKLTAQSVFKQTDFLNFYVTMQQQELSFLQSEIQFNNDYLTLNYLCGIVDTVIYRLEKPAINDSLQYDFYQSVFYKRFITDSLRIANERLLLDYQYKPKIGAYADAGYVSSLLYKAYKNFGFSFGISLNIPLYDGGQKKLKVARLNIAERTRQAKKEFYLAQYQQQVAQLNRQLHSTDLLVNKINQQIKYASTLVVANGKLLQTGDIAVRDYVLALNNYLAAKNQLTQNVINRLHIVNQINYWNY
jgi:hypothetical protein